MSDDPYYLPYNFVPVTGKVNGKPLCKTDWHSDVSASNRAPNTRSRHDIYHPEYLTGVITCEIETVTPTIIGNKQKSTGDKVNSPIIVTPYKVAGQHAIPGNSLRGMFASIAEAISQSSLRVLDELHWPFFGTTDTNLKEGLVEDLRPFNESKTFLTPAELLFGAVSVPDFDKETSKIKRALASRVRFTDALLSSERQSAEELEVTPLSSPQLVNADDDFNLEAASTYFAQKRYDESEQQLDKNNVTKQQIDDQLEKIQSLFKHNNEQIDDRKNWEEDIPFITNGRKFYLLQENGFQKGKIKLIKKGTPIDPKRKFTFSIFFKNLTNAELGLLITSITPSPNYYHSIGLGKSRGFGDIKISKKEIQIKDVKKSYSALSKSADYSSYNNNINTELVDKDSLEQLLLIRAQKRENVRWRNNKDGDETPRYLAPHKSKANGRKDLPSYVKIKNSTSTAKTKATATISNSALDTELKAEIESYLSIKIDNQNNGSLTKKQQSKLIKQLLAKYDKEDTQALLRSIRQHLEKDQQTILGDIIWSAYNDKKYEIFQNKLGLLGLNLEVIKKLNLF